MDADRFRYETEKKAEDRKFQNELEKVNKGKDETIEYIRRFDHCKNVKKKLDLDIHKLNDKYEELLRKEKLVDQQLAIEYDYKKFVIELLNT